MHVVISLMSFVDHGKQGLLPSKPSLLGPGSGYPRRRYLLPNTPGATPGYDARRLMEMAVSRNQCTHPWLNAWTLSLWLWPRHDHATAKTAPPSRSQTMY